MGLMPLLQRYVLPLMQARAGQRPATHVPDAPDSAPAEATRTAPDSGPPLR